MPRGRGTAHGQAGRREEPAPRGQQGQQRQPGQQRPRGAVRARAQALPRPGATAPTGPRRQRSPEPAPRQQVRRTTREPAGRRSRGAARRAQRPPLRLAAGRALLLGQRAVAIGLGLAVLTAFVVGVAEQRWKERELRGEVAARTAELRAAEERNQELKGQLAASDPEGYRAYVEATARKQLNLGYPDETVMIVAWNDPPGGPAPPPPPPAAAPQTPAQASAPPVWQQWLRLLTGQ